MVVVAAKANSGWWGGGEDDREDWGNKVFENYGIEIQHERNVFLNLSGRGLEFNTCPLISRP